VNRLLEAKASVFGIDLVPAPESVTSPNFKFLQINLCDQDAPSKIVSGCKEAFGTDRIDALLNVAGIMDYFQSGLTVDDDIWEKVMTVNLTAPVRLTREVLKVMQAQKSGSIVNVVSKAAISGACAGVAYTASKHALVSQLLELEDRPSADVNTTARGNEKHRLDVPERGNSVQCHSSGIDCNQHQFWDGPRQNGPSGLHGNSVRPLLEIFLFCFNWSMAS
jgi:NAD(P)-dependent dehydrogenase (short-subunit alcohol dehydrogenase family)